LENRARFALEVVRGIRAEVGPDYPILYRLSVMEPYEGGLTLEEGLAFCEMLEPYVDALDVSAGNYDTAMTLLPMVAPGSLVNYAKAVKQRVSVPVIGVGRLTWLLDEMARAVSEGELDFVALGRSGLADPDTVAKTRRGQPQSVRRCLAVNECISRWMFNGKGTQCVINPALGQERRADEARRPAAITRRVLVIGGGPSGCEAAILAAQRGHSVTLLERDRRLGGQLHAWAAASPLRIEVNNMIQFYESELERVGVKVHLQTDAQDIALDTWDSVFLATGTESEDAQVDIVEMMSAGRLPTADQVTVYGETEVALFAALWLAENGKQVRLLSPSGDVGIDTNDMQRGHLTALLHSRDVAIVTHATLPAGGEVIIANPRTATTLHAGLVDDFRVHSIGTRARGGRMYEATQSGFWAAARLGETS
jgi:2,4-dienoyl-CoA reductase (NADPH2)